MHIGVVGYGVVGKAIAHGFLSMGHKISVHDIALDTSVNDVIETDINFICVPTRALDDGRCDISIVCKVVKELIKSVYKGILAVKSTVAPGTTDALIEEYPECRICFVPEFLRERCAVTDFKENHDVCVIGTEDEDICKAIKEAHGDYPDRS